jgi:hypothetical protein
VLSIHLWGTFNLDTDFLSPDFGNGY